MSDVKMLGDYGCYIDESNVISFQVGDNPRIGMEDPGFSVEDYNSFPDLQWQTINGYQVCSRGHNNMKCEEVAADLKKNRLLPRLITKQMNMLYGKGPAVYKTVFAFRDYFVKWRFSVGRNFGALPVAGIETMENRHCRLATTKKDAATDLVYYRDFRFIAVGRWNYGISNFKIYPKFNLADVDNYKYAAISHHREKSVDEFYGVNETHEGTKEYIRGSNATARYINSFLRNSLAAKIHIIIPNAWINAKRTQIQKLCDENKKRNKDGVKLYVFNGIDIGTEFKESTLIKYIQSELRKISQYLSGADNQGKAYATISFKSGGTEEERWKIETVDLKYKEYIESLITYDKRADEVLLSSVGLDSSISSVGKDGVISKSGSDAYYNYLIYLMSLTPDEEICCEPFNWAIQINFPLLYKKGYRIGFYREIPSRQEEVKPNERLNQQES